TARRDAAGVPGDVASANTPVVTARPVNIASAAAGQTTAGKCRFRLARLDATNAPKAGTARQSGQTWVARSGWFAGRPRSPQWGQVIVVAIFTPPGPPRDDLDARSADMPRAAAAFSRRLGAVSN